jgi:nicotinamidase-related amidase
VQAIGHPQLAVAWSNVTLYSIVDDVLVVSLGSPMKTLHEIERSVVLMVDLQERLMPAIHDGTSVVSRAIQFGKIARLLNVPVIGTEQSPNKLGANLREIRVLCSHTVAKDHFNACEDGLLQALPAGRPRVLVAGCEAHVCVLQTVLGLLDDSRDVTVISDAIGSRASSDKRVALNRLTAAGAVIATVEMIAFEWLRSSQHPKFREALALIK